jgi:hypothetical protein
MGIDLAHPKAMFPTFVFVAPFWLRRLRAQRYVDLLRDYKALSANHKTRTVVLNKFAIAAFSARILSLRKFPRLW